MNWFVWAPLGLVVLSSLVMIFALFVLFAVVAKEKELAPEAGADSFSLENEKFSLQSSINSLVVPTYVPMIATGQGGSKGEAGEPMPGSGLSFAIRDLSALDLTRLIADFEKRLRTWESQFGRTNPAPQQTQDLRRYASDLKSVRRQSDLIAIHDKVDALVMDIVAAVVKESDESGRPKANSDKEKVLAALLSLAGLSFFSPSVGSSPDRRECHSVGVVRGEGMRSGLIGKVNVRGLKRGDTICSPAIVALTI